MSEKRRDHRGRILHNGEIQLSDGRYLSMSMRWKRSVVSIAGV